MSAIRDGYKNEKGEVWDAALEKYI